MKGLTSSGASSLNISTADMDFYRFSGNDITKLKYQELKDFAETGYPIIFDDKLLNSYDNRTIDNRLVDDSSYIYRFLQEGINNSNSNILPSSAITENRLWIKNILEMERLSVTMIDAPQNYTGDTSSRIVGRSLSFEFRINKPATSLTPLDMIG